MGWDRALLGGLDGDAGSNGAFWVGSQVKNAREFRTAGHRRGHENTEDEFHGGVVTHQERPGKLRGVATPE